LDIASGHHFICLICDFFSPRHSGFASLRHSGLCALRLPVRPTSAASAAQTTFDIRSILLLDIEGHRTLTLTFACSLMLPRTTTAALAARSTQTAFGCSTFWALWCP
ncbi:hypothetical protein FOFC_02805, partial [Fusarium oxysporum]